MNIMRLVILFLTLFFIPLSLKAESLPYLDGFPLMSGFQISNDDVMVFDKPQGRIVEMSAWCATNCPTPADIQRYYQTTAPSLGWKALGNGDFQNKNEHLSIEIHEGNDGDNIIILFRSNS